MAEKVVKTATGEHGTVAVPIHQQKVRVWMQVIVSLLIFIGGFLVVFSPNHFLPAQDESTKKLAAGWIGAAIGYWLS